MAKDQTIHLMIVHQHEEEAERLLSILRNAQISVRPNRCIDEDSLIDALKTTKIDLVLVQHMQSDLPLVTTKEIVNRTGKDIPVIALLQNLDNDSISEAYEDGIINFCCGSIHDHLCSEIVNIHTCLLNRRKLRKYEADLNDIEKRVSTLLDSSKDAIAYIHEGMHVYTNNAYQDFFKYDDPEEMEVTPFLNLVAKEQVAETKKLLRDISKNIIPENDIDMKLKTEAGDIVEATVSFDRATVDGEPCVQFLVQPPKANLEAEKELQDIKTKDMLTGFYNRNYFVKYLSDIINSVKSGKSSSHSLLFIQIDNHNKLEKELGKGNYDLLIADMAPYIKDIIGKDNFYARYDVNSFIIEIKEEIESASQQAKHLIAKVTDHFFSAGERTLSCTISIGLTQIIEKTESGNDVIKILENETEKAFSNGGSEISIFDPAEEEKKSRAANQKWIDIITSGIADNNFILNYQQVISLQGDETEHYETLVRLKSDDGLLMPADFIGVAKKHGLIIEIDKEVIRKAILAIKQSTKDIALFVKMSTDTLSDASFPTWLAQELKSNAIPGDRLIFEVPESELVSHSKHVKPIINAIKGLNCLFAIEKFGSGLNSFTLLKHYPVDFLKIDSTFMQDFAKNDDNQKKVKEIIDKGHAQNKLIICEFIEDATTMSILWKFSANYVQGNFLAPPQESMTAAES